MQQAAVNQGAVPPVMTKSAYAAYKGLSPSAVSKAISRRQLTPPALRPDGTIDRALADEQLAARRDPSRYLDVPDGTPAPPLPFRPGAEPSGAFADVKADTERLKQRKLEIEIGVAEGRYIAREEVDGDAFAAARSLRDGMYGWVRRMATQLPGMTDPREIEIFLMRELKAELAHLAENVRHGGHGLSE